MRRDLLARTRNQATGMLLAAAAAACAGKSAPVTAARPASNPAAPAALLLPQTWRARVQLDRRDSIVLTLPAGETQLEQMRRHASFTLTVGPRAAVTIRLDSLEMSPPAGPASLPVVGTVWTGRMLGTGVDWFTTAGAGPVVEELRVDIAGFFPHLPSGGIVAGSQWQDTSATKGRVDIFETTERLTTQWLAGKDTTVAGAHLLPLRATSGLEQSGKGTGAGVEMKMTGQGSRSYTYYLSKSGQIDLVTRTDSVNVLISIPSSHQLVPTVRFIRSRVVFTPLVRDRSQ